MINQKTRLIERKINNTFFYVCLFITFLALGMILIRFFTRGQYPEIGISIFYIGVLLIYSLHKETIRWITEKESEEKKQKPGEWFVFVWIIVATLLYLINFFSKDYYRFSPNGQELYILTEAAFIALEVGAVFILARILKIITLLSLGRK